jgi:glutaminyl-peptide cyclotransferase
MTVPTARPPFSASVAAAAIMLAGCLVAAHDAADRTMAQRISSNRSDRSDSRHAHRVFQDPDLLPGIPEYARTTAGGPLRSMPVRDVAAAAGAAQGAKPAAPPTFSSARAWEHLRRQVGFGPRPAGSAALEACRRYILAELKAAGIDARQQLFIARTPLGETSMANIIATIPGRRRDRIVLASHFDTKLFRDIRFVGASDGASSTAALLELGRAMKARTNELTIELLFFDGEEAVIDWNRNNDNTYGSRYYVQTARKAGTLAGIKAMVLLDMIGDRDLVIRRDTNSTVWLTDIIWSTAARLGHSAIFSNEPTEIADDHLPFLEAGIPAVDVIDLDYPQWHTAQDDLEHVSARSLQIVGDVILASLGAIEKAVSKQ